MMYLQDIFFPSVDLFLQDLIFYFKSWYLPPKTDLLLQGICFPSKTLPLSTKADLFLN